MIREYYAIAAGELITAVTVIIMLKKKYSYERILTAAVLILYMTGVICLTIFPIDIDNKVAPDFNIFENNLKLIPFDSIHWIIARGNNFYSIVQTGGNILMTIPLGLLLPAAYKPRNKGVYFLIFFLFTLTIEASQFLIGFLLNTYYRTADVDDLILNFTGAMLGYLLYHLICKAKKRKDKQAQSADVKNPSGEQD